MVESNGQESSSDPMTNINADEQPSTTPSPNGANTKMQKDEDRLKKTVVEQKQDIEKDKVMQEAPTNTSNSSHHSKKATANGTSNNTAEKGNTEHSDKQVNGDDKALKKPTNEINGKEQPGKPAADTSLVNRLQDARATLASAADSQQEKQDSNDKDESSPKEHALQQNQPIGGSATSTSQPEPEKGKKENDEDRMDVYDDNHGNSRTSSPAMIEDEALLKTDEELPPYDFETSTSTSSGPNPNVYIYASSAPAKTLVTTPSSSSNEAYNGASPAAGTSTTANANTSQSASKPTQGTIAMRAQQGQQQQGSRAHPGTDYTYRGIPGTPHGTPYHPSQYPAAPSHHYTHPSQHDVARDNRSQQSATGSPQKRSYPTGPTAAVKPIRRLAKIRPYANQNLPVMAHEIRNAIPKDASSVFHVLDRRVNLDSLDAAEGATNKDVNVPIYSLLRAWVQDDPYRQIPPSFSTLLAVHHGEDSAVTVTSKNDASSSGKRGRNVSEALLDDTTSDKKQKATVDVLTILATAQRDSSAPCVPSMETLKKEIVQQARQTRKRKSQQYKRQLNRTLQGLRQRGIMLG